MSGGVAHDFPATSGRLADALGCVGIASTIAEDPEAAFASLPDDDVELVTVNALRWRMKGVERYADVREEWALSLSEDARRGMLAHLDAGRPLLALHAAPICFDDWAEWGRVIGAAWDWDRSGHPALGEAAIAVHDHHPIVAGLADFMITDEVYGSLDRQPDLDALLSSPHGGQVHPLLWARTLAGGARVVTDLLGHDTRSYDHPTHQQILQRIGLWLRGRPDAEVAAA